jgi:serine/threonine-protein kinase RsbW
MRRLTLPATLESLQAVSKFVKEVASEAELDKRDAYRLRLAAIELATNAITHGHNETRPTGMIELEAETDNQFLTVALEDTGIPYDPSVTPPPNDLDRPPEDRQIGGLGVYLALQNVDAFRYQRLENKNRSVLVINRTAPKPAL